MGFIPDSTYGTVLQSGWQSGVPEERRFLGMNAGIKFDRKTVTPITCYRCAKCGLLRMYARPDDLQ